MLDAPLTSRDRFLIGLLAFVFIAAGVLTEIRSAFLHTRHTDLTVYLRASWAIRAGLNPYTVPDDHGWHYTYPSLLAITLIPFADAPPGTPQPTWAVPYPISVAVWYLLSVALLAWSVHHLCRALEETQRGGLGIASPGTRRFWWTRLWPILICLPAIGSTVVRGQVNILVAALVVGCIVAVLRGRRATAGWWLAAATCIKVIPALLILYPIVKRDWRMVRHFTLGVLAGIVVIPVLVLGPSRAMETTETFVNQTLLPGLTTKPGALSDELTSMTGTDNQSIRSIIHTAVNWGVEPRPRTASAGTKLAHAILTIVMIIWTFLAARRIADERYRALFLLSGLTIVAVAVTPVNHTHYMVLALPAVLGLVVWELEQRRKFRWGLILMAVMFLHVVSGIYPRVPVLPGYQAVRDLGFTMLGTLLVWYASLRLPVATPKLFTMPLNPKEVTLPLPGVPISK